MGKTIVVGGGYAGLASALELRSRLPGGEDITLVSAGEQFIFYPSLIWVVQGERELDDISFPIRPVLEEAGIEFLATRLDGIDASNKILSLSNGQQLPFDKLLMATGGEWQWETVPGLAPKPRGHTVSMLSPSAALNARADWQNLLADPGPVVVGLTPNASLYGAAYEFTLNLDLALRQAGIRERAPLIFVTPEPYLGHFGHDGLGNSRQVLEEAFEKQDVVYLTEVQIDHIEETSVVLTDLRQFQSRFTMIVPSYRGIKPVREVPGLADADGRIPVDDYYRSLAYPDIFAAGVAIQIKSQATTLLPCGVLVPGTVSAEMGRLAATNLAADLGYGQLQKRPDAAMKSFYVLDSGGRGLFMSLGSRSWLNVQLNVPGPWSHWAKVVAEKYQMWQLQSGRY